MYNFSICSIFKNEAHVLEKWIQHYIYHGVEHFYLINDNSSDKYMDIIDKYSNYITLFNNDVETITVGSQSLIYEKYFRPILQYSKWIAILDLDEFLYSPNEININNIINKYARYSGLIINWLHIRGGDDDLFNENKPYFSYKMIFLSEHLIRFGVHLHIVSGNIMKCDELNIPESL